MSIRLDPRRLAALKLLASESGVRPGELVTTWLEERIDAARAGEAAPVVAGAALAELEARLDAISRRLDALETATGTAAAGAASARRGRPRLREASKPADARQRSRPAARKRTSAARITTSKRGGPRVALHDEIIAIISERGPLSAADLAAAVVDRARYAPPRSAHPIDASVINSRVSNPVYRDRFVRREGRIGLAGRE